uniref:SET domain-containing protein n=1 Tax=viral metagenome TaxID=1070528 RepID=A0A6C0D0X9_9ZZZZ
MTNKTTTNPRMSIVGIFGAFMLIAFILILLLSAYFLFSFASTSSKVEKRVHQISTQGGIYIGKSKKGGEFGRGVFANKPFKKGEVIESGPMLVDDVSELFCGLYKKYVWNHKDNQMILVLGYASICNHDDDNNADVIFYDDWYQLIAIKDIKTDEEITNTYCKDKTKQECEDWFSGKEIEKI